MASGKKKGLSTRTPKSKVASGVVDANIPKEVLQLLNEALPDPETVDIVVQYDFNEYKRGDRLTVESNEQNRRYIDQGAFRAAE